MKSPEDLFRELLVKAAWQEYADPMSAREYRRLNGGSDEHPLWCGHFAAICAREAGIDLAIARSILPSTYRLASASYADSFYKKIDRPPLRPVFSDEIKPGHIVTVKTSRDLPYGDHVVIPVEVRGDLLICIEGNARGLRNDGSWAPTPSVVLQVRRKADVRGAYEVGREHLR